VWGHACFLPGRGLSEWSHEPVPALGNGLDVARTLGVIAQGLPQRRYVSREPTFLHERIGPDELHELVLFDHAAVMREQNEKGIGYLRGQWNAFRAAIEHPLCRVESEDAKLESSSTLWFHGSRAAPMVTDRGRWGTL
jgi:hypothetical protein